MNEAVGVRPEDFVGVIRNEEGSEFGIRIWSDEGTEMSIFPCVLSHVSRRRDVFPENVINLHKMIASKASREIF